MTTKTVQQYSTTYTIAQFGNHSFRISFIGDGEKRIHNVVKVFPTIQDAEDYIRACANMDKLSDMVTKQ